MKNKKLIIKNYHSPDVEKIWEWKPNNDAEVFVLLQLQIGFENDESSDGFSITVATPVALMEHPIAQVKTIQNVIRSRATLIVDRYSWDKVMNALESIVQDCEAENWVESANKLQRYFRWEYEDFKFIDT